MSKTMVQIKFTIESDIVSTFKARCASESVSMASVISEFMKSGHSGRDTKARTESRGQRKKTVEQLIASIENVMNMEERYRDAIPEQFEARYENANHTCEKLAEAISCLEESY